MEYNPLECSNGLSKYHSTVVGEAAFIKNMFSTQAQISNESPCWIDSGNPISRLAYSASTLSLFSAVHLALEKRLQYVLN